MSKRLLLSIFVSITLVVGAFLFRLSTGDSQSSDQVSLSELKVADGREGRACWLAVDGIVYEIEQGYKWSEGAHSESSLAYCGADMSTVIDKAPHGRTKLSQLKKVGTFVE